MESSSEDSFVWSDASPDTSDADEMAKTKEVSQSDAESEYGKSYKNKLQRELFANGDIDDETDKSTEKSRKRKIKYEETEENGSPMKKKIKIEPESDAESAKKSKRKSKNEEFLHDEDTYDESYLNLRVKQEQTFTAPTEKPKKKKRKSESNINNSENEIDPDTRSDSFEANGTNNHTADSDQSESKKERKKKKSKKKRNSTEDSTPIEEKFTAEETIVESRRTNKSLSESQDVSYHEKNERKSSHNTENSDSENHIENNESHHSETPEPIDYEMQTVLNKKSGRTISERIRFEDESDLDVRKSVKDQPRRLKNYLKANVNLKPTTQKLNKETVVTSDDEIFIIKCPSSIDASAFQGVKLNLDKKCKIKLNEQTYEGYSEEEESKVAILSLKNNKVVAKPVPVSRMLCFRKRIPKVHIREENYMVNNQTNFIPLPETKCRHPLFGPHYKKAIKLSSHVAERLKGSNVPEEIEEPVINIKKKKKKKDKVQSEHEQMEENANDIGAVSVKKNKKRKHTVENTEAEFVNEDPHEVPTEEVPVKNSKKRKHTEEIEEVQPKKSKKKHNLDSAEAWESEKAIEDSLFNF